MSGKSLLEAAPRKLGVEPRDVLDEFHYLGFERDQLIGRNVHRPNDDAAPRPYSQELMLIAVQ